MNSDVGNDLYALCRRLWPINRSLTGDGVRTTLRILGEVCEGLEIREVASGTRVFDWEVPDEWNVREAYVVGPDGERLVDFADHNLHLVGYSIPVDMELDLDELQDHLFSLPDQPDAIPYVTSYYRRRWGFCLTEQQRAGLAPGRYRVKIDADLAPGHLSYGEALIPGETEEEVFLSTYVCHPSMANNELSGPAVTAFLARWLSTAARRYTYRIVFIPETIGSITYLSQHLEHLKRHVVAGFNVSCVGDDRTYSFLPSRAGDTLSDRVARHVLRHRGNYEEYSWRDRGSDERQYCAPGVDLPIASMMRSKYGRYPEYHTSLDDLERVVTPQGLRGGYEMILTALEALEANCYPRTRVLGEPQLGRRGLYPTISRRGSTGDEVALMMDVLTYSDGTSDLIDIAETCNVPVAEVVGVLDRLFEHDLIDKLQKAV